MSLPQYQNSSVKHEQTQKLHKLLVQTVIDFLKEEKITEVWEVQFKADELTDSASLVSSKSIVILSLFKSIISPIPNLVCLTF